MKINYTLHFIFNLFFILDYLFNPPWIINNIIYSLFGIAKRSD